MTDVGIMSMQRIRNYGSTLQAHCLRRLIEDVDPANRVSFVDYRPGVPLVEPVGAAEPTGGAARTLAKVREYGAGEGRLVDKLRFFNHKRTYADRFFPILGLPPVPVRDLDLDVQVIGSDEVFNCVQSNPNVGYSRDLFGHGSPARRLVSYAASFGNTTLAKIDSAGVRADLEEDLARFAAISVRDRNSAHIVEALTGETPSLNVDPALAYDLMALEERVPAARQVDDKYLIVYGYSGRLTHEENRVVRSYARERGARVLCFGGVQGCCDRFVDCDPFQLLAYFRDAEAVITDTFHGTIFSIINRVPFATIVRPSTGHGYGNEEKLGFLLEQFGLSSRKVADATDVAQALAQPIDQGAVAAVLERERASSREFLAAQVR